MWTVSYILFILKMSVQNSPELTSHFLEFWESRTELKWLPSFLERQTATAGTSLQNNLSSFPILPFRLGINMRFQFEKCYASKLLLYRQEESLSLQQITPK